jgi:hypothetical protein
MTFAPFIYLQRYDATAQMRDIETWTSALPGPAARTLRHHQPAAILRVNERPPSSGGFLNCCLLKMKRAIVVERWRALPVKDPLKYYSPFDAANRSWRFVP